MKHQVGMISTLSIFHILQWSHSHRSNQQFPSPVSLAVLSADIVLILQGRYDPLHGCDGFTRCAHKFLLLDAWVLCGPLQNSQFLQRAVQSIKLIL